MPRRSKQALAGMGLAVGAPFAIGPSAAHAIEVTNTSDGPGSGPAGSLRAAVFAVNSSPTEDTITFASSVTGQITLTSGALSFIDGTTIIGPGAKRLTISGNDASRIFYFDPSVPGDPARVSGLTLTDGAVAGFNSGGAIVSIDADLDIVDSAITSSRAREGGGVFVDDDYLNGRATNIIRSTLSGNTATNNGGGIAGDGSVGTLVNSTISGNHADFFAGGVYFNDFSAFYGSTIAGNTNNGPGDGAGIYNEGLSGALLAGTIVADNTGGGVNSDLAGTPFTAGYSLIESPGTTTVIAGLGGQNIIGRDPQLGPLADNGGPTPTQRPSALGRSPAIDAGRSAFASNDQRGNLRPFDSPLFPNPALPGANGADIGAVELQAGELPKKKCKKKKKKGSGKKGAADSKEKKKKKCKKKRKKKKGKQ